MGIIYLDSFEGYDDTVGGVGTRNMAFGNESGSVSYISRTGARSFGPIVGNLSSANPDSLFYYNANPKMRLPPMVLTSSLGIAGAFYLTDRPGTNARGPLLTINVDGWSGYSQTFRGSVFIDSNYQLHLGVGGRSNFAGGGWSETFPTGVYIPSLKWSHLALYVYSSVHIVGTSTRRQTSQDNRIVFVDYVGLWDIALELVLYVNGVFTTRHIFIIGYHDNSSVLATEAAQIGTVIVGEDIGSYYTNLYNMGFVVDDLYIFTIEGDIIDLPIDIIRPNGFNTNQWLPSDPTKDNWELVRDASSDEDLTVVTSSFGGQLDMYEFEDTNLGSDSLILAVQLTQVIKKNATSVAKTSTVWDPGGTGTRYVDTPNVLHDGSHVYFQTVHMFNPVTGHDWTVEELDNILAGVMRVA